jgi:hypothetical protein
VDRILRNFWRPHRWSGDCVIFGDGQEADKFLETTAVVRRLINFWTTEVDSCGRIPMIFVYINGWSKKDVSGWFSHRNG